MRENCIYGKPAAAVCINFISGSNGPFVFLSRAAFELGRGKTSGLYKRATRREKHFLRIWQVERKALG
jgi:hypothetical protein